MNNLIENNNQQILINQAINSRMHHLVEIVNNLSDLDFKSKQQQIIEINLLQLILNMDTIQHQIEILEDAILLAKHGIPSSRILSIKDFMKIKVFLMQQNITVTSFEHMLTKATAQVAMNTTHVIYMLKIPQLSDETFNYEYVEALIHDQKRITLQSNYILVNKSHVYETRSPCSQDLDYFLCDPDMLKITNQCVNNLTQMQHANCSYEKVYTTGIVKRINDATILLNNVNTTLQSNCSNNTHILEGSFLIQFSECILHLEDNHYSNAIIETTQKQFRLTTGLIVNESSLADLPSPEYLGNLTLEHRSMLKHVYLQNDSLQWKFNLFGIINVSTVTLIIIIIGVYITIQFKVKRTVIEVNLQKEDPTAPSEVLELNSIPEKILYPDISAERIAKIQQYLNMPTQERSSRL